MSKLRVLDLFSGIGGFSLGLERTGGFETVAFCEIEPFPRKVLAKHWPEVPCYEDVTKLTGDILARDGIAVDVITGGFPCQDISSAGKQAGIGEGTRSGLWSEIVRLIGELSPRYVIVENVAALLSGPSEQRGGWFGRVLGDLAECGYDAEWRVISAASVGAPHRRNRVWVVAYPAQHRRAISGVGNVGRVLDPPPKLIIRPKFSGNGADGCPEFVADAASARLQVRQQARQPEDETQSGGGVVAKLERCGPDVADANCHHVQGQQSGDANTQERQGPNQGPLGPLLTGGGGQWLPEPAICRVANGVPNRVDRLKGLGNAVVPQIVSLIGEAILQAEAAQ